MTRVQVNLGLSILLPLMAGCAARVPLIRPIACAQIIKVSVGMSVNDVRVLIGTPSSTERSTESFRPDATHWDRYSGPLPEYNDHFEYRDSLIVGYKEGRLVYLFAQRVADKPRPALLLAATANGQAIRDFGPAFEQVFHCDPGFERPIE